MESEFKDICSEALLDSVVRDFLNAKKDCQGAEFASRTKIKKIFPSGNYLLQLPSKGGMCKESVVSQEQLRLMTLNLLNCMRT